MNIVPFLATPAATVLEFPGILNSTSEIICLRFRILNHAMSDKHGGVGLDVHVTCSSLDTNPPKPETPEAQHGITFSTHENCASQSSLGFAMGMSKLGTPQP